MDFKFHCPHCSQHLEGPMELAGVEVQCPTCAQPFTVSSPPRPNQTARITLPPEEPAVAANGQVKHWIVDARVLVLGAPPATIKTLIEVPKNWTLPIDEKLPEPAFDAVKKAMRTRFPQSPITPIKIRAADAQSLHRISEPTDYTNGCCRIWFLGRAATAL